MRIYQKCYLAKTLENCGMDTPFELKFGKAAKISTAMNPIFSSKDVIDFGENEVMTVKSWRAGQKRNQPLQQSSEEIITKF